MKRKTGVILTICALILCAAGATFHIGSNHADRLSKDGNYIHLSAADSHAVKEETDSGSILIFEETFFTNSEQIRVKNNGDSRVDVYLYYKDMPDLVLQQFTLESEGSKVFSNLTSRFLYQIGVEVPADGQVSLTVSR